jgi:flagellar L-ring protein precursor FlgH
MRLSRWKQLRCCAALLVPVAAISAADKKKPPREPALTPIEVYAKNAEERGQSDFRLPGSIWQPGAPLAGLARDPKAGQVDDLLTIVVAESASAVSTGTTKTSRQSSSGYSIASLLKPTKATGPLANLLTTSGNSALNGQGTTSRDVTLTTTLSGRVVQVLPNGYLVLEGSKSVVINSETHLVTVRGVARPADITPANQIQSDQLAQMEVRINGKGVVNDAIKRPFVLYRLLMGLLPF